MRGAGERSAESLHASTPAGRTRSNEAKLLPMPIAGPSLAMRTLQACATAGSAVSAQAPLHCYTQRTHVPQRSAGRRAQRGDLRRRRCHARAEGTARSGKGGGAARFVRRAPLAAQQTSALPALMSSGAEPQAPAAKKMRVEVEPPPGGWQPRRKPNLLGEWADAAAPPLRPAWLVKSALGLPAGHPSPAALQSCRVALQVRPLRRAALPSRH